MSNTVIQENTDLIADLVIQQGVPDEDSSTRILRLSGHTLGTNSEVFTDLLDDLTAKVISSHQQAAIQKHRHCLQLVLHTLIHCIFRFEWLSLPTNPDNFALGEYLTELGFDQRRMKRIIDTLQSEDLMMLGRKGFQHPDPGQSKASQFFPTEKFIRLFSDSLYSPYGDFDDYQPYRFKRFDAADMPSDKDIEDDVRIIKAFNEFMRDHTWAMKNPCTRGLSDFVGRSGRISNYYQSLANRRIPLRTSTLIDGEAIAEPDFSCNHLRMASYLVGEELPNDPYTVIANDTELTRDAIKSVITASIGAAALFQKGGIIRSSHKNTRNRTVVSADSFKAVLSSLESNYPWLKTERLLFNDIGTRMQYLEGEIALQMIRWAVEEQVPLIPVHDAFAVRHYDEAKTYKRMHEVWTDVMQKAKESDFIGRTQYTVDIVQKRKEVEKERKRLATQKVKHEH